MIPLIPATLLQNIDYPIKPMSRKSIKSTIKTKVNMKKNIGKMFLFRLSRVQMW
jgi:hypothetical protein